MHFQRWTTHLTPPGDTDKHTILQAPPTTDYEAATAKVLGPDEVLAAPMLQGQHRVYRDLEEDVAQRIIEVNERVWEARYSYQGNKIKGACFIEELGCGCVSEIDGPNGEKRATFQTCQQHSHHKSGWCCEESVSYPCVCIMAQWCPEHGEQHRGTHD